MVYRILSIDGGGICGTYPASILATVEDSLKRDNANNRLVDYFDLVVGTSTGGIIALGLGAEFSCQQILGFYEQFGPEIFHLSKRRAIAQKIAQLCPISGLRKVIVDGFREKYSPGTLHNALNKTFEGKKLGDSCVRLAITSMNPDRGTIQMFKTAHHPKFERDYLKPMSEVGMATSAAPTYFRAHVDNDGIPSIDGGMCANNPILVGVVEAIGILNWPREELRILSLGCTNSPLNLDAGDPKTKKLGEIYWAQNLLDTMMTGQSSTAMGQAELLTGKGNILRINETVPSERFNMDNIQQIKRLVGLGASSGREHLPKIRAMFIQEKAKRFSPYH
jgi:uncharacterized protein